MHIVSSLLGRVQINRTNDDDDDVVVLNADDDDDDMAGVFLLQCMAVLRCTSVRRWVI